MKYTTAKLNDPSAKELNLVNFINSCSKEHLDFFEHFNGRNNLSALDLGCRVPSPLFALYHVFDFSKLIAIDKDSEKNCALKFIKHWNSFHKSPISGESFFEIYQQVASPMWESPITDKAEFNATFKFEQKLISEFISAEEKKYDIIIGSNVLHFFSLEEINFFVGEIKNMLNQNGIFYTRIQNKGNGLDADSIRAIINSHYQEGALIEIFDNGQWHATKLMNYPYIN